MKILLHSRSFFPRVGGLEQTSLVLASGLAARGHVVTVATDVVESWPEETRLGFEVVRALPPGELVSLARAHDVVHSNGHGLAAFGLAIRASRPLVVTHQGYQAVCLSGLGWHDGRACGYDLSRCFTLTRRHQGLGWATRQLARHGVARATLGRATHVAITDFVARTNRLPKAQIVPNCADTNTFRPGIPRGPRRAFLFVGRFVGEKGVAFLLDAYARYRELGGQCGLVLAGSGPEEATYREAISRLAISDQVELPGTLRGDALAEAYRECLAVVVPSVWDEAQGIVAAEAICSGRLALVTRAGGLPEVVDDEALTLPMGDREAWAMALLRMDRDEPWRRERESELPANAERFTPDRMVEGYLAAYARATK